mmetsp:Transcript_4843/g.18105  ORF Transcript_4843/g.18105 Transcript_4843/m.18105 type:complete len:580 (-) Transcript_4843:1199-2938(-)|eukprot:CAMPEP_0117440016 /NCGR_PEP_ID=MMETSP0759-20121206/2859_1 /TAXON_ID=63605 /ORGANISM="Percolomonas cosmopolitus, Strain WS" /LENGTH=579 /DNA_ID=CAMNT_0005231741 /DNA_START=49 /DNA_END=1788 /DNA_ORIENTATION=+
MPAHKAERFHSLYNHPKHTKRSLQEVYKFTPLKNEKLHENESHLENQVSGSSSPGEPSAVAPYKILLKRRLLATSSPDNDEPQIEEIMCRELGCQTVVMLGGHPHQDNSPTSTPTSAPHWGKSSSSLGNHHRSHNPSTSPELASQTDRILSYSDLVQHSNELENQLRTTQDNYIAIAKKEEVSHMRYKDKMEEWKWIERERMKRLKQHMLAEWATTLTEEQVEQKWKDLHGMLASVTYDAPPSSPSRTSRKDYLRRMKPRRKPLSSFKPSTEKGILNELVVDDLLLQEVRSIKCRGYRNQYRMDASVAQHLKTMRRPKKKRKKRAPEKCTVGTDTDPFHWNRFQVRNLLPKLIRKLDQLKHIDKQKEFSNHDGDTSSRISLTEREEREAREYRISNIIQFFADNEEEILEQLSEETDLTAYSSIDFNMLPKAVRNEILDMKAELKQKKRALKDLNQVLSRLQANPSLRSGANGFSHTDFSPNASSGTISLPKISVVGGDDFHIEKSRQPRSLPRSESPSKNSPHVSRNDPERGTKLYIHSYTFNDMQTTGTQDLSMIPFDVAQKRSLMWHPSKGYAMRL